jgi:hypothetical protein
MRPFFLVSDARWGLFTADGGRIDETPAGVD